jgi:hypothetical protein
VTEWRGIYRKLADAINQAIDKSLERAEKLAPQAKKKANLDEILGPTPASHVEPYFGFADGPGTAKPKPAPAPAAAPVPVAAPMQVTAAAAPPMFAMASGGGGGAPERPVARQGGPTGAFGLPAAQPAPPMPAPAAPVLSPQHKGTSMGGMAAPKPPAPTAPVPLTTASSPKSPPRMAAANDSGDPAADGFDEATHFREVYAEYLTVRRGCGEGAEGLSYEKFENTLIKTRDQVLSKHPGRGVRFTVYVKEGKAALKAAPIKK